MVTVRPATVADAPAMGQLVVRAWQAAYRGQMPDDYLIGLQAEERAAYWDSVLRREDRGGVILVAERVGAAQAELDRMGFAESVLWVLPGNARARRFYERAGWAADGIEKTSEAFGVSFDEVRYRRGSTSEAISSATPAGTE